ncbi:hypothetical protein [Micromonospora zhanjiangensis]|uniref:DUF3040 domain-containing protein n=1 Tax=Micromonospora zhanjiangensis TaxID=1522057 RepID=A0ABV8KQR6_9ACTN
MDVTVDERGWPLVVGADPDTRAAVRTALRDGRTDDPRVDALVRDWQYRWRIRRWLLPVSVLCCLAAVAWADDPGLQALLTVGGVAIGLAVWRAERTHRRLSRYQGLDAADPAETEA